MASSIVPAARIVTRIHIIREQSVMLDSDLAELYEVKVKHLNESVRRNIVRFPDDFMFQLTFDELQSLRSNFSTLETGRGKHRKYAPFAFTEQGVAMLSAVLRSPRAIQVNIQIMRTFVELRRAALTNDELRVRLDAVEKRMDRGFRTVFAAIRKLIESDDRKPTRGFGR